MFLSHFPTQLYTERRRVHRVPQFGFVENNIKTRLHTLYKTKKTKNALPQFPFTKEMYSARTT